jgi:transcriptional regulator with PAS, ATPase and Fis domain
MRTVVEKALRVARLDTTVLLTGESGTGKELVANLIYKNSERTGKPFIKINCAAIPENLLESEFFGYEKGSFSGANKDGKAGIFELVNGGTIFLDEIGDLPIMLQSKLLRVIQEKEIRRIGGNVNIPIDVRIITATNLDLAKAVEEGRFREDLFYRLNVVPIVIPPLRERKDDIEKLTIHFVEKFNKKFKMNKQISPEAISILQSYDWPGNVRELRNVLERIFVAYDGRMISKSQVENQLPIRKQDPENIKGKYTGTLDQIMDAYEKELLISLLNKHRPVDVANLLGVNKSTISRKIRKHNIRHSSIVAK